MGRPTLGILFTTHSYILDLPSISSPPIYPPYTYLPPNNLLLVRPFSHSPIFPLTYPPFANPYIHPQSTHPCTPFQFIHHSPIPSLPIPHLQIHHFPTYFSQITYPSSIHNPPTYPTSVYHSYITDSTFYYKFARKF